MLRRLGLLLGFLAFLVLLAALVTAAGQELGLEEAPASVVGWLSGLAGAVAGMRFARDRRRKAVAARIERERTAGAQLRRQDPVRYRELRGAATEAAAYLDADAYVGRQLAMDEARNRPTRRQRRAESRRRRARTPAWQPAADAQLLAVEALTAELERATLVRKLPDSSTEVLGLKRGVCFRYRVDPTGATTLLSTDATRATWDRWTRRVAGIGILLFVGSGVVAVAIGRSDDFPGWLVPFMVVGFVLAFVGEALTVQPQTFVKQGEHWHQAGSGWD